MFFNRLVIIFLIGFIFCSLFADETGSKDQDVYANESLDSLSIIQDVVNLCVDLSEAVECNDTAAIKQINEKIKSLDFGYFSLLTGNESDTYSLNGHMVFNKIFVDCLANGVDAFQKSDIINKMGKNKGQVKDGQTLTKTCFVKANETVSYSFDSSGYQELSVVTEPGGRITMRVHAVNADKNYDKWFNDTKDVIPGRTMRKTSFTLPDVGTSKVTLEVKNCTNKDFTFFVISN